MKKTASLVLTLLLALSFTLLCTCSNGTSDVEKPGTESPATPTPPETPAPTPTTPTPTYAITITPIGATGSETVVPSVTTAAEGTTITLTATLGAGRRVVLSAPGVTISPSTISTNNSTTTFVMPGAAVTITATFSDLSAGNSQMHIVNGVSFNTNYTPSSANSFIMGEQVESTTQTVTLTKNFWMGETEVTQGLWEAVWGATWPGTVPSSSYGDGDNKPAYNVNWYDAVAFCNLLTLTDESVADTERVYYSDAGLTTAYTKANAASSAAVYVDWTKKGYRLPTDAEWEYAARYIDGTSWTRGDHVSGGPVYSDETDPDKVGDYAWYSGNNGESGDPTYGSKDVGQKTANALGLKDMSGNVYEWCYDWYAAYSGSSETDPTGPVTGSYRVIRGGSWSGTASSLRCASRYSFTPTSRGSFIGFRLCRTGE